MGMALRHTDGHALMLRPLLESVWIPDVPMLRDALAVRIPRLRKVLSVLNMVSTAIGLMLASLLLAFAPFAAMRYTATAQILLNATGDTTTNNDGLIALPWGETWDEASEALTMLWAAAVTFHFFYDAALDTHPVALKLLWFKSRMRLLAVLGSVIAYAVAEATLLPNPLHVLWLACRSVVILWLCLLDHIILTQKLRFAPTTYAKLNGAKDKGHGVLGTLNILGFIEWFATDVFRHLLVQYKCDIVTVAEFGFENPFNHNRFGVTNHQIANACYVTSLIFTGGVTLTIARSNWGAETTLLSTRFAVVA